MLVAREFHAIFNPGKESKYDVTSENWRTGFCSTVPAFYGQLKWCSGNLHPATLILLLFYNKWKFYHIFADLLTTCVKLAFEMQFKQGGLARELLFSAKPL